ncbi:unnamed protein product [Phytophthora lilii]|uniref:Unnamed protein product n=1 Tax=Phytophthora lilii TaxID=2077276 RepID=A0A9W6WQA1_9STRA|nr:unnamed protein product [Phytophthora lilii]
MATTEPVSDIVKRIGNPQEGDTDAVIREFLATFTAKELRSACKIYHVKVRSKNSKLDNKIGYENVLVQLARSRRESEEAARDERDKRRSEQVAAGSVSTRKTKHCCFRLLNVLFSDRFVDQLGLMGARPTRRELDAGAVRGRNSFWKDVAAEFIKELPEYGRLVTADSRFDGTDPSHIVPHAGEKLQQIWKEATTKFATAHARATQSGTHEPDFYDFCSGQLEPLYINAWLTVRPQAFDAAVGSMPKSTCLDTLTSDDTESKKVEKSDETALGKRRRAETNEVITYLETRFGSHEFS